MTSLSVPIRLSVAAPAYNEAEGIESLVAEWHSFLSAQADVSEFEIVICNDGSRDRTGDILDRLTLPFPQLRVLHFARNQGGAAGLKAAIAATRYDWVLLIDSDGQFPIAGLTAMIAALCAAAAWPPSACAGKRHRLRPVRQLGQWPGLQPGAWQRTPRLQLRLQAGVGTHPARAGPGGQGDELFHRSDLAAAGTRYRAHRSSDRASSAHDRHQQHEACSRRRAPVPVRDLYRPAPDAATAWQSHPASYIGSGP